LGISSNNRPLCNQGESYKTNTKTSRTSLLVNHKFPRENKDVLVQGNSEYGFVAFYEIEERTERVIVFEEGETEWLPTRE